VVLAKERVSEAKTYKAISNSAGEFRFDGLADQPYTLIALKNRLSLEEPIAVNPRSSDVIRLVMNNSRDVETAAFQAMDSVIAIATAPGFATFTGRSVVLLATPSERSLRWQMRTFETPGFESSALSASGTKLILQRRRKDADPKLKPEQLQIKQLNLLAIDLTTPVNSIVFGEDAVQATREVSVEANTTTRADLKAPPTGLAATGLNQHDLGELLPIKSGALMRLIKDAPGFVQEHPCITSLPATTLLAVSARGTVFCADTTHAFLVSRNSKYAVKLPYLPNPSSMIVADGGDPRTPALAEFLEVSVTESRIIDIKDATSGEQLHRITLPAQTTDVRRMGILAALALQSHSSPQFLSSGALAAVDSALVRDSDKWEVQGWTWEPRRTRLDERVYAPVLEFERNEPVFPARVDVWKTGLLKPKATLPVGVTQSYAGGEADARHRFFLQLYDSMRRQGRPPFGTIAGIETSEPSARCAIYYKVVDLGTTWLIQYWFYYPFDVGGYGSHLHDSEHLFVEVDKLGGAVLNIIGAAHGGLTANNVFRSASSPLPVSLPLFAIVELGKHATAPDVNRDGRFTPGLDDNIHHSTPQLWGVRDAMGHTDSRLGQFGAHMAADHTSRLTHQQARTMFSGPALAHVECACDLVPLPEFVDLAVKENCTEGPPWGEKVAAPGSDCGLQFLLQEPDRTNINRVWKKWNFPAQFIRAGWRTASSSSRGGIGVDFAIGLEQLTKDILHGRMSAGVAVRSSITEYTLHYEQPLTNLFGWFAGGEFNRQENGDGGFRLVLGPAIEVPLPIIQRPGFIAFSLGLQDGSAISMQWRFSVGLWARQRYRFVGVDR
jgi:hypothetical protein